MRLSIRSSVLCASWRDIFGFLNDYATTFAAAVHEVIVDLVRFGGNANFFFGAEPQWNMGEQIVVSALIGSAAGHNSPDLSGTLEVAFAF